MQHVCQQHGLKQLVRKATRGDYLLDLVLTDSSHASVRLGPKIADNSSLLVSVKSMLELRDLGRRHVWHYRDADWPGVEDSLRDTSWHFLNEGSVDEAMDAFYDLLYSLRLQNVPNTWIDVKKSSLPWLNAACQVAIARKHAAENTAMYEQECQSCRNILDQEYAKYRNEIKKQMSELPRASKK